MRSLNDAGDVEPADKAVVDDDSLCSVLALSLYGKDLDFLDKLSQEYRRYGNFIPSFVLFINASTLGIKLTLRYDV